MKKFFKISLVSFFFLIGLKQSFAGIDLVQLSANSVDISSGSYLSAFYSGSITNYDFVDSLNWTIFETRSCSNIEIQYLDNDSINYVCNGVLVANTSLYLNIARTGGDLSINDFVFTSPTVTNSGAITNTGLINTGSVYDFPIITSSGAFVSVNNNGSDTLGSTVADIRMYIILQTILFVAFLFYLLMDKWLLGINF